MKLTVALIQLNSILKKPQLNINTINELLSKKLTPNSSTIDLIVLPELAITGYNFKSPNDIKPYLEKITPTITGPSLTLAKSLSVKHSCYTIIGYPELYQDKIYNSCAMFDKSGEIIHNYRKTFLYETDEVWGCNENPNVHNDEQFKCVKINLINHKNESIRVNVNFGICMDLNPYKFEQPFNKFEFSISSYLQRCKLIICPMAWLSNKSPSINKETPFDKRTQEAKELELEMMRDPQQSNMTNVNYWILRFFPFLNHENSIIPKWFTKDESVHVLICNRVGVEDDIVYGGSSCILRFNNTGEDEYSDEYDESNPSVKVLDKLSQVKEDVLIHEIDIQ